MNEEELTVPDSWTYEWAVDRLLWALHVPIKGVVRKVGEGKIRLLLVVLTIEADVRNHTMPDEGTLHYLLPDLSHWQREQAMQALIDQGLISTNGQKYILNLGV